LYQSEPHSIATISFPNTVGGGGVFDDGDYDCAMFMMMNK
jgi:hypothetical protein